MSTSCAYRTVNRIVARPPKHWVGDGFNVYPVFDNLAFTKAVSPMLMFDYAAPKHFEPNNPSQPKGVGQHPHRGFETVTIAFQGEVEHRDNKGGHGIIKEGDIQWMTAGRGVVHEEYHSKAFSQDGGTFEMAQLWVNLPKKDKMVKPRYQAIDAETVPTVKLDDSATARIIAGTLQDVTGPAKTYSPVNLWDVSLPNKGSTVTIPYPTDHSCIVFVRRGSVTSNDQKLGPQTVALLNNEEGVSVEALQLTVLEKDSSVLIMGGESIDEPIANMGPFVMNTQRELQQAARDYRGGKF